MKVLSFLKIAAVSAFMLVGVSVSAPAQAAVGSWNDTANGPTITQTNWGFLSGWANPSASTPSTAIMTGGSWAISCFSYPAGFVQYLDIPSYNTVPLATQSGSFTAGGISANQSMRFMVGIISNPTRAIAPVVCGGHQLAIFYQY